MNVAEPRYRALYADEIPDREPQPFRAHVLAGCAALILTAGAGMILIVGVLTAFQARRLYAQCATVLGRGVLRLYGVTLRVHGAPPWPTTQTVYVSNHTSTLDLFILVALGLPNTRFFLSSFLRRILPLGVISSMMGTFFTVPQSRPAERVRIFQRAEQELHRTGESVYLSPEGGRVTTGEIGHFNKGAFHLAMNLRAPIVPFFIRIPKTVDPRRGLDARPGTVDVYVLPSIETGGWHLDDLVANKERVRDIFVGFQEDVTWG
jgi:1-acyl-sn-glycerol-3-phosphate acyltransferase